MKAQSYGKYDVFDDETAMTWEQAEALAQRARGKDVPMPPTLDEAIAQAPAKPWVMPPGPPDGPITKEAELLNRALILLIHLRERIFKEDPQVETWVNEILSEARS